jgi:Cu(I)/Ag(I) efflux system membrane fusion protein
MFATLSFTQRGSQPTVLIPSEALIRTGQRSIVILALGEGRFRAADVQVGAEAGDRIEIREGIRAGDKVVLSGQFLIDSEASLTGAIARLESQSVAQPGKPLFHSGQGVVTDLDIAQRQIQLDHDPIASLQWPQMKMWFSVHDASLLQGVQVGHRVQFELTGPDDDGHFVIHRLAATPSR